MRATLLFVLSLTLSAQAATPVLSQNRAPLTAITLAETRDLRALSISPDGAWVAFQIVEAKPAINSYTVTWRALSLADRRQTLVDNDGGEAGPFISGTSRLEFYSHEPPPPPIWSPDSTWFAYLRWDGTRAAIWRARARDGRSEQLTHSPSNIRRFVYSEDGARILYQTEPSLDQTRSALVAEGRRGHLFDDRFYPAYDLAPLQPESADHVGTGDQTVGSPHTQSAPSPIWTLDLPTRRERPATAEEIDEFEGAITNARPLGAQRMIGAPALGSTGALAWRDALDPQQQGYQPPTTLVAQSQNQAPVRCNAEPCENQFIEGVWWRNPQELIFLRSEGTAGDSGLYAWNLEQQRVRSVLHTQARLTNHWGATGEAQANCAIAADRLVCAYEHWDAPRTLVAIDLDTGAIETLFDPNPQFANYDLGPAPRRLEFTGSDGHAYYGVLALPRHRAPRQRLPLVIVTHRCTGFLRGGAGDEYPVFPLAEEGFAVLCLEKDEGRPQQARLDAPAYNNWFFRQENGRRLFLESLRTAINELDRQGVIDPRRVAITGLSRGAQEVGWAITSMPELAAAVASGPPGTPGPFAYYLLTEQFRQTSRQLFARGSPSESPDAWRRSFSPQARQVFTPLLINAADHELMLTLEPIITLRDAGRAVEMFVYPGEYHWKWQPSHRLAIYQRNMDWMNFWLRGVESNHAHDASQYVRWRTMRERQCALLGHDSRNGAPPLSTPWYCQQRTAAAGRSG